MQWFQILVLENPQNYAVYRFVYTNPKHLKTHPFLYVLAFYQRHFDRLRRHFCPAKTELFEDALPSKYIWKHSFCVIVWTVKTVQNICLNNMTNCSGRYMFIPACTSHVLSQLAKYVTLFNRHITFLQRWHKMCLQLLCCGKTWVHLSFRSHVEWRLNATWTHQLSGERFC